MPRNWIDETDVRRRAWRALIEVPGLVLARMDEELRSESDLPLVQYDALLHIAQAGEGGVRMSDLAGHVLLTKAGLTSLVDRLERRGLVRRVDDPDDRRVVRVVLTDDGWARFRGAASQHVAQIERYVTDWIDAAEAEAVVAALQRVREHLEAEGA